LWTKTTLFVVGKKVVFENPVTGTPQEVVSGQYLLEIPLKKVVEETSADIVTLTARRQIEVGRVSRSRGVSRNAWVVSGTRIPVASVKRLHEDGFTTTQIIEEYPDLTEEDVAAALKHKDSKAA
jgi:hypothetical protein